MDRTLTLLCLNIHPEHKKHFWVQCSTVFTGRFFTVDVGNKVDNSSFLGSKQLTSNNNSLFG